MPRKPDRDCMCNYCAHFADIEFADGKLIHIKKCLLSPRLSCDLFTPGAHYPAYLNKAHWKKIRQIKLYSVNYRCEGCGSSEDLQVHHIRHQNLCNESLDDLQVLCTKCHAKARIDREAILKANWLENRYRMDEETGQWTT